MSVRWSGETVGHRVGEICLKVGMVGTAYVTHPRRSFMPEGWKLPDTCDPRTVKDNETRRVKVGTTDVRLCSNGGVHFDHVVPHPAVGVEVDRASLPSCRIISAWS